MGGCAPYFYLIGMFKSSTKAISLGLVLGPKMYLLPLLSSLLSICSCTWLHVVLELNTISKKLYCWWFTFSA